MIKSNNNKKSSGMTYIELIVVLGIFSLMATVLLFKYSDFGKQVDLQNLSQDIALEVVHAQKISLSGLQPSFGSAGYNLVPSNTNPWKPAYGVYFNTANPPDLSSNQANPSQFITFVDGVQNRDYDELDCNPTGTPDEKGDQECIDVIDLARGDKITNICVADNTECDDLSNLPGNANDISVVFTRPDSSAFIVDDSDHIVLNKAVISISDQDGTFARHVIIFASGRIETD
jgi:type II secretory pathway pseudopilin PulG